MKKKLKDLPYFPLGLTALWVLCGGILFYYLLQNLGTVADIIQKVVSVLNPFIWGFAIAYLLLPVTRYFEYRLLNPLATKLTKQEQPNGGAPRVLAIAFALAAAGAVLFILIRLLVPTVYDSVTSIYDNYSTYINNLIAFINRMLESNPELAADVTAMTRTVSNELANWVNEELLPMVTDLLSDVTGFLVSVTSGVYRVLQVVLNILIGVVISCYLLYNREKFAASSKRLLYVVLGVRRSEQVQAVVRFANEAFTGFLTGKIIDSTIIGVITLVCCSLLNMPYPAFIAIIIGVTNIIPVFGPFIGAVPCTVIILMVNPVKALGFVVLIFIIQQFDGNILGPKILGNSVGINGFWIMFSIIVMGDLFGVVGMLLGVPLFVVISAGYDALINLGLKKRGLSTEAALYVDMHHMDVKTGVPVPKRAEQMTVGKKPPKKREESPQSGE